MIDRLQFHSGRPLKPEDHDLLGLEPLAEQLTKVLCDESLKEGFVLGIEGPWGSGKSSLLKKTIRKLCALEEPPTIVEFNPWLVGDKLELISEYFIALNEALDRELKIDPQNEDKAKTKVKEGLEKYAKHINAGAKLLSVGAFLIPQLETASKAIKTVLESLEEISQPEPLHKQKEDLENALREISRPIIVFVDDTERLDPPEVMETLRLLRSVGDLPNIVYVVAYDRAAMVRNISIALNANELESAGASYLEKIVQAALTIPHPEDFALRRWLKSEVLKLHQTNKDSTLRGEALERLELVIDKEGGRMISTPRDVIRLMNNIKITWPAVRDFVDVGDLVWIHLLKLKRPNLYHWVENYLNEYAEVARGTASASNPDSHFSELLRHAGTDYSPDSTEFYHLARIIPGLRKQSHDAGQSQWTTYSVDSNQIEEMTRSRRLGSPHYYRYYFALGQNQGFIPADRINAALEEIHTTSPELKVRLQQAAQEKFKDGELHYPILLDSLGTHVLSFSRKSKKYFLGCILDSVESAIQNAPPKHLSGNRSVTAAKSIVYSVIDFHKDQFRELAQIVDTSSSLSFISELMSDVVYERHSGIELSDSQRTKLKERFSRRMFQEFDQLPNLARPNFAISIWHQSTTDKAAFKTKLRELYSDPKNLIMIIGSNDARGSIVSTSGKWKPLDLDYFAELSGDPELPSRIAEIVSSRDDFPSELQQAIDNIIQGLGDHKAHKNSRY